MCRQGYYAAQEQYYQVMQHQLTESYSSNQEAPVLGDEMSDLHERPLGEEMSTTVQSIGNMETESNELSAACPTEMPALKTSGMVNETCSTSPALPERLKKKCVSFDERDSVCLYDPGAKSTPFAEGDLFNEFIKGNVSVSPREENLSPISPFQSDEMLMQEQHTEAAQPIIDSLDSLDTLTLSTVMPLGAPRGNRLASSTSGPQKQLKNFLKRRDGTEKMTETGTMSLDVPNIEPLGSLGEQKESLFCRRGKFSLSTHSLMLTFVDGRYPKHNVATNILMLKPGSVHERAEKLSEKQNGKTTHHTDIRGLDTQSNLDFLGIHFPVHCFTSEGLCFHRNCAKITTGSREHNVVEQGSHRGILKLISTRKLFFCKVFILSSARRWPVAQREPKVSGVQVICTTLHLSGSTRE